MNTGKKIKIPLNVYNTNMNKNENTFDSIQFQCMFGYHFVKVETSRNQEFPLEWTLLDSTKDLLIDFQI